MLHRASSIWASSIWASSIWAGSIWAGSIWASSTGVLEDIFDTVARRVLQIAGR